ncbi:SDR family oxidoreductase [Erythrobacter sp. AP23]|uniref:SDR family oxidoreductase n=1 Tax=Erythrobacter sp. AP23 TaxID=499656 RepID=UPI00076C94E3|nr:SDR family oxidoreductase [Erythrobacter sp. AP23]KWV94154.1 hypothetical protein ASS64_09980 [Erythrobacter sp. AP23]
MSDPLVSSRKTALILDGSTGRGNGVVPGDEPSWPNEETTGSEQRAGGAVARIPAGRMGTPQDMAGAALLLVSPLADYVVGQIIRVDGGMTLS